MIVSKSNTAPQSASITVNPASDSQDVSIITDGDFSSVYTDAMAGVTTFTFNIITQDIGYIAIGGSNFAKKSNVTIKYTSASVEYTAINENMNHLDAEVLMFQIDAFAVSQIKIEVTGSGQIAVADITFGEYYVIPRGEQSGFSRPWSVPNTESRSAQGLDTSPINLSYQGRPLACTLTIPNNIMVDYDSYYEFLRFAVVNTFYALEDNDSTHSYACFNTKPDMTKAHSATRELGVSTIKFSAYSKTTEGLFIQ